VRRRDLIRHLEQQGCRFLREGSSHTLYINPKQHKVTTIPRHREINEYLARKICRDLNVSEL
jgi:mRNA interferase HicA